jgi:TRAP-type C4-dicarboxylate transport system permease large subunit
MIPYGLAGEAGKVKLYFGLMIPAFILGFVSAIAYYYYRGKSKYTSSERLSTEVHALAQAGRKPTKR